MWRQFRTASFLIAACCLWCASVEAGSPEDAFANGNALLAQGDLNGALKAFAKAATADRTNQQYLQQFMLVRRAVQLKESVAKETDAARWMQSAQALRAFFVSNGLHAQALPIDQEVFRRAKTADSAVLLAETLLAMDRQDAAAELLGGLDPAATTPATQALLSVSLARQGKLEEAQRIAQDLSGEAQKDPASLYLFARMQAVVGAQQLAVSLLTRCFESVPPSQLDNLKTHVRKCPDFQQIASTPAFAKALQVTSKVPESQCSGGTSCGNCPLRGNCAKGGG